MIPIKMFIAKLADPALLEIRDNKIDIILGNRAICETPKVHLPIGGAGIEETIFTAKPEHFAAIKN